MAIAKIHTHEKWSSGAFGSRLKSYQDDTTGILSQNPSDYAVPETDAIILGAPFLICASGNSATQVIFNAESPKLRVLDVWAKAVGGAGGASDTALVDDGTTAITDAIDMNVADNVIVRAATIDDAKEDIAENGTLRVIRASAAVCDVYILCCRIV